MLAAASTLSLLASSSSVVAGLMVARVVTCEASYCLGKSMPAVQYEGGVKGQGVGAFLQPVTQMAVFVVVAAVVTAAAAAVLGVASCPGHMVLALRTHHLHVCGWRRTKTPSI